MEVVIHGPERVRFTVSSPNIVSAPEMYVVGATRGFETLKRTRVDYPPTAQTNVTFKKAPLAKAKGEQAELPSSGRKRQRRE